MKITIITACYNAIATIKDAMASIAGQRLQSEKSGESEKLELGIRNEGTSLEYIVVDGGSTDGTVELIRKFEEEIKRKGQGQQWNGFSFKWISEKDKGLYDALNKGIKMASGDVVGICNADDVLADDDVVAKIAEAFLTQGGCGTVLDAIYADIRFVKSVDGVENLRKAPVTRYCTGRFFRRWMFRFATFPAHPSTFVRREWFERTGWYSLDYGMYGDFEFMLRLFWKQRVRAKYRPICTHVMRAGGASTDGINTNIEINRTDLRALRDNGYWSCLLFVYAKYPFKIFGIIFRNIYMKGIHK